MALTATDVDRFEAARPRLEAVAYRLLGSAGEAEDVVQESFLRWQSADVERIEVPEAWLTKVVTNLCLNQLSSARARRETYVGQWLPEPLLLGDPMLGDPMLGPAETAERRESISYAVMVLLERLPPQERAVYVLREAFGHPHAEIAEILDISESASQQLLHRARKHVESGRVRTGTDRATAERIVEEFLMAATSGRTEPLLRLLTDDAVAVGDGGGTVPAAPHPFSGAARVAVFLRGLFKPGTAKRKMFGNSVTLEAAVIDDEPAVIATSEGQLWGVMVLDVGPDGIRGIHNQVNPDKLARLAERWAQTPDRPKGHTVEL